MSAIQKGAANIVNCKEFLNEPKNKVFWEYLVVVTYH